MSLYALTILVFATTRSNAAVSALVMSFLLPTILLSAVAGVLVDRLDVRWAMIVPNAIRTVLTLGLALAGANVAMLLLLNLGISLTTVILTPAEASMIPRIVPKAQLQTAMGIFNLTLQASFAVGFAFLGPARRRARRSVVRARRRHRLLRGGDDHDALPAVGAAGRPRARRRSAVRSTKPIDELREGLAAISGNREVGRPLIHLAAVGVARRRDRRPGAEPRAVDRPRSEEPDRRRPAARASGSWPGCSACAGSAAGIPRRRAGEGGLIAFGSLALAIAFVSAIAERRRGLPVDPARRRPGVRRRFGLRDHGRVGPDGALREHAGRRPRSRVRRAGVDRQRGQPASRSSSRGRSPTQISGATVIALAAIGVLIVAGWSATLFGPRGSAEGAATPRR